MDRVAPDRPSHRSHVERAAAGQDVAGEGRQLGVERARRRGAIHRGLDVAPQRHRQREAPEAAVAERRPSFAEPVGEVVEVGGQRDALRGQAPAIALIVLAGVAAGEVVVEAPGAAGEAEGGDGEAAREIAVFEELGVVVIAGEAGDAERDLVRGAGKESAELGAPAPDGHEDEIEDEARGPGARDSAR